MHVFDPLRDSIGIGRFSIQFYALAILIGILTALWLAYREVNKLRLNPDDLSDGFIYGLIYGILGARLYYVIFEWSEYKDNVITALYIWNGGLAIHGTILAVGIFLYFYVKKRNLNIFKYIELLVPGFLLAQGFGRWGNFFNQEAHGGLVPGASLDARRAFLEQTLHLPKFIVNQMYLYGPEGLDYYHPTFLYESLWNVLGFVIMFFVLRKIRKYWIGDALSFYLVWYSLGRFFIEDMRTDSLMSGPIQVARMISLVLAGIGIAWFVYRRKKEIYPVSYLEFVEGEMDE
ncbi:prolipoprotein diacylglyceryl transferase [Mycoplasmatota bacterium zrk1]